jgi:hypothetical protein
MTDLKIQIPQGASGVTAVDKAGWTATVTADTIEFSGGSLDAATEDHFDINITVPTLVGTIYFPAIETCAKGELAWIEIPAAGAPEPELPAPSLKVTDGPPTSADLTPVPEEEEETTAVTTAATGTADIGVVVAPTTIDAATADDSSNTGTIVVVVVVVAVVLIGGGIVLARRRTTTPRG